MHVWNSQAWNTLGIVMRVTRHGVAMCVIAMHGTMGTHVQAIN